MGAVCCPPCWERSPGPLRGHQTLTLNAPCPRTGFRSRPAPLGGAEAPLCVCEGSRWMSPRRAAREERDTVSPADAKAKQPQMWPHVADFDLQNDQQ